MNPGGIVVAVLGVWLGCQIFGGNMLERLGIIETNATPPNYTGSGAGGVGGNVGGTADHPQTKLRG